MNNSEDVSINTFNLTNHQIVTEDQKSIKFDSYDQDSSVSVSMGASS